MADNLGITPGAGTKLRTTEAAGVHTPHHLAHGVDAAGTAHALRVDADGRLIAGAPMVERVPWITNAPAGAQVAFAVTPTTIRPDNGEPVGPVRAVGLLLKQASANGGLPEPVTVHIYAGGTPNYEYEVGKVISTLDNTSAHVGHITPYPLSGPTELLDGATHRRTQTTYLTQVYAPALARFRNGAYFILRLDVATRGTVSATVLLYR